MADVAAGPPRQEERGAILLLTALIMMALLGVASLVTDLGAMRVMRRSNQTLVDLAALAAGDAIGEDAGPNGPAACEEAVRSLRANAPELATLSVPCSSLPYPCTATTASAMVERVAGSYVVQITHPVPNAAISDPRVSGGLRADDGEPCERLQVNLRRTRDSIFAGTLGRSELSVSASSVVRQVAAKNRRVPSLWLLDPYGCDVLSVQGGAKVTVGTATRGGLISVDSDGSTCSGNSYTVDVGGSGSFLRSIPTSTDPPGMIALYAMRPNQKTCSEGNLRACDPSDVANSTLSPQPIRRPWRATRAPVDHIYNCRSSYPAYEGITVNPCENGTASYIDQLRTGVGTSGLPAGFQRWSTSYGCVAPAGATTIQGNWLVDCATFEVNSGADVTFASGNVVFNGGIKMTGGTLTINSANPRAALSAACLTSVTGCLAESSAKAAWIYMRSGSLNMSGGGLIARNTTIYQHSGFFAINGGSPPIWLAPKEGPFSGLAVWSELPTNKFQITGGASMQLEGVFFIPFAKPFSLSGGSPFLPQQAQFIAHSAAIGGGAVLTLSPNSTHAITIPAPPVSLIR